MFTKTVRDTARILRVQGDLDIETFPRLLRKAEQAFEEGRSSLIIDLSEADLVTTGGMIALQTIAARAEDRGGKATLTGVKHDVAISLNLAGLFQACQSYSDTNSAALSFAHS